jgi:PPOX class probable F420-dependent enzyme
MQKPSTHRRREIQLTPDEQHALLHIAPKAALATLDQDGFPHVVAMSYLAKDGAIYMTSYAKAQKVLNIRRNPRVGVLIETGERYTDYRGVMVRGCCEIIEDPTQVETIIQEIGTKNRDMGTNTRSEAVTRARKRVILKVTPEKIASWDHTKLGGRY